ncbi:hypothetical protein PBY51_018116 [Eleginops maclovinus]|uniref:Uncharacterized protein n=1 Tax=Eleginops maclovinus TaxID=56733 RepID=A0AAN7XN20_ELEMC|nr:hypothetical protein PBY51_018116 [Eleginops maclovinus]
MKRDTVEWTLQREEFLPCTDGDMYIFQTQKSCSTGFSSSHPSSSHFHIFLQSLPRHQPPKKPNGIHIPFPVTAFIPSPVSAPLPC